MPNGEQATERVMARVRKLAQNLWWTWHPDAQHLFASLDPRQWEATRHSPLATLLRMPAERQVALSTDPEFIAHLERCEADLSGYLAPKTYYSQRHGRARKKLKVAYFCAEFGLHESLPIYCGGLGILAGDHLKSASDLGIPLVGVGLFYHRGYYQQELLVDGKTRVLRPRQQLDQVPLVDTGRRVTVPMARRRVQARVWLAQVGRVPLYLLDTDLRGNRPSDRRLTDDLYGGDAACRIEQEIILGIGGLLALDAVGEKPTTYHLNEGHAAFCALERLRRCRAQGLSALAALNEVRGSTVFTTHTPVPAGHDRFAPSLVVRYLAEVSEAAGMNRHALLGLGRENPENPAEDFCMTVLALKLAAHANGVSELHGEVSRKMWMRLYGAHDSSQVPIGSVTNGVHSQTWLAPELEPLYARYLRPRWVGAGPDHNPWQRADRIPPAELWAARDLLRRRLIRFIRQRLVEQALRAHASPEQLAEAGQALNETALTIGFARRFATYKRAPLVFRDTKRLLRILEDPERPVQLVFAGKAHPADRAGQEFVQEVFRQTRRPGLRGKVVFVEEYDMEIGRRLVSGCDVWLNNPIRPHEASGTSGMKVPLHGGLNCSVLDGWWPEAFDGNNGWEIGGGQEFSSPAEQDRHDAESLYRLLEEHIVPTFYDRDRQGLPKRWLKMSLRSLATVCGRFSSHRMVGDYLERYYLPARRGKGAS